MTDQAQPKKPTVIEPVGNALLNWLATLSLTCSIVLILILTSEAMQGFSVTGIGPVIYAAGIINGIVFYAVFKGLASLIGQQNKIAALLQQIQEGRAS